MKACFTTSVHAFRRLCCDLGIGDPPFFDRHTLPQIALTNDRRLYLLKAGATHTLNLQMIPKLNETFSEVSFAGLAGGRYGCTSLGQLVYPNELYWFCELSNTLSGPLTLANGPESSQWRHVSVSSLAAENGLHLTGALAPHASFDLEAYAFAWVFLRARVAIERVQMVISDIVGKGRPQTRNIDRTYGDILADAIRDAG